MSWLFCCRETKLGRSGSSRQCGCNAVGKLKIIKHLSGGAAAWLEWSQQSQGMATVGTAQLLRPCRLLLENCRLAVVAGRRLHAVSSQQLSSLP